MLGVMKAYFEQKSDKFIYHKYLQITSKTVRKCYIVSVLR